MPNQRINDFLKMVDKLGLRFPVATIARETGYSKGMVSRLLKGEDEPSEFFLIKFKQAFMEERNIVEEDEPKDKQVFEDSALGTQYKNMETLLAIVRDQASTIASQQETIKLLTLKLP